MRLACEHLNSGLTRAHDREALVNSQDMKARQPRGESLFRKDCQDATGQSQTAPPYIYVIEAPHIQPSQATSPAMIRPTYDYIDFL